MSIANDLIPEVVPLARAPAIFGVSRSGLYRLAAAGSIKMIKVGSRTLVDANSIRSFLELQPRLEPRRDPTRVKRADHSRSSHGK